MVHNRTVRDANPGNRLKSLLRLPLVVAAFAIVYIIGAVSSFVYRERINASNELLVRLPKLSSPTNQTRLTVIAPHCDDEILGCAGLIQQTLAAGGAVQTIILTNGDGYPAAVQRERRGLKAIPADFISFATLRQGESKSGLAELGAGASNVLFLGYPDGGLLSLWSSNWSRSHPFTSRFTGRDRSPYPQTYCKSSVYCGEDLTSDLVSALGTFHPTIVVVTHPSEDHTDHAAAATFTALAVKEVKSKPEDKQWANSLKIAHYLIHRGDWPLPQGLHTEAPLVPPSAMNHTDTVWRSLLMTSEQISRKAAAIKVHQSQTLIMPAFMNAFVRKNELFGEIPDQRLQSLTGLPDSSGERDWRQISPAILDPLRDNVVRDLQGGADIAALYCAAEETKISFRLQLRRPISGNVKYRIHARVFLSDWKSLPAETTINCEPTRHDAGAAFKTTMKDRCTIKVAVPYEMLGIKSLRSVRAVAVWANTLIAGVEVDRTAVRIVDVSESNQVIPAQTPVGRL